MLVFSYVHYNERELQLEDRGRGYLIYPSMVGLVREFVVRKLLVFLCVGFGFGVSEDGVYGKNIGKRDYEFE